MDADTLLTSLIARGITLMPDGASLRARGTLTDDLRQQIRTHKAELLAALAAQTVQAARAEPEPRPTTPEAEILSLGTSEAAAEHFAERAAIAEFDGELPRSEADAQARGAACGGRFPYYFRLVESPGQTPVVITGAAAVDEARAELAVRFGTGRVLSVWPVGEREVIP